MSAYHFTRESAYYANMQLPKLGLVNFTFGNVSAVDRSKNVFAIKPRGVPYEELTPEKMVVVEFDDKVVDGRLRPSSDTNTHAILYKCWKNIGGIVHTILSMLVPGRKANGISQYTVSPMQIILQ